VDLDIIGRQGVVIQRRCGRLSRSVLHRACTGIVACRAPRRTPRAVRDAALRCARPTRTAARALRFRLFWRARSTAARAYTRTLPFLHLHCAPPPHAARLPMYRARTRTYAMLLPAHATSTVFLNLRPAQDGRSILRVFCSDRVPGGTLPLDGPLAPLLSAFHRLASPSHTTHHKSAPLRDERSCISRRISLLTTSHGCLAHPLPFTIRCLPLPHAALVPFHAPNSASSRHATSRWRIWP